MEDRKNEGIGGPVHGDPELGSVAPDEGGAGACFYRVEGRCCNSRAEAFTLTVDRSFCSGCEFCSSKKDVKS